MTQIIRNWNWWWGSKDAMLKTVYDPNNIGKDAFNYENFINTPEIPAAQVQADWDEADNTKVDYIKNKPTIPAAQIQSDWTQSDNTKKDFIKNKPSIPTKTSDLDNDSWFITKDVDNLTNYKKTSDLPDFSTYQLKSNMVTSLNSADNTHYPTAKAVKDAISASWWGDVSWPASSVDGHLAVFDWVTGKIIKDGWEIPTPTTVVDNLTTQSATSALSANQGYVLDWKISTINDKIPSEATSSNKLADKQFVNDAINSVTAYYITKDAAWNQFATKAELTAATVFYSGWVVRVPTRNDYTIVLDDETHNDEVTRYIYNNGWEYQYTINESPLTQAQLDALNSGITSWKVSSYDSAVTTIWGYGNIVTHNTSEFATSTQWSKADSALQPWDNITELNNNAWYITWVDWGDVWWTLSDQVDLSNALWAKANNSDVVHTTWAETINWSKTFGTSPAVPAKNTDADAANTTVIATEAQVAKKQDTLTFDNTPTSASTNPVTSWGVYTALSGKQDALVSWTNIKTINWEPVLGSWDIEISWWTDYSWVTKTIWDTDILDYSAMRWPCDEWYHIPLQSEWQTANTIWQTLWAWTSSGYTDVATYLKLPLNWFRFYSDWQVEYRWTIWEYWSSDANNDWTVRNFSISSSWIYDSSFSYAGQGWNIRAFSNTIVVPDSSWTVLYQGTWDAWIYHNSTLGLISLSSDWTTWITIADKNLWATSVWNNGDTLSAANCWYYYQRGNNNWFAWSWSLTTSTTLVDASSYWPWNYYSSSTFIKPSSSPYSWDSSNNLNLRWWETWATYFKWVELSLRTIVNAPSSDFLLTAPATLAEWEEYVIRIISEDNYTMTLWAGFTNPWNVDTSLSFYATDQFVFLAVWWVLELQPLVATWE